MVETIYRRGFQDPVEDSLEVDLEGNSSGVLREGYVAMALLVAAIHITSPDLEMMNLLSLA